MRAQICQILLPGRVALVCLRQECIKWIERVVGVGEDRKNAGMSHITYKKQGGYISIVQKARGLYLNNGKCIILISKCQLFLPWIQGGRR
jgi:hypothetical protein